METASITGISLMTVPLNTVLGNCTLSKRYSSGEISKRVYIHGNILYYLAYEYNSEVESSLGSPVKKLKAHDNHET